jgi:hypothetical protein
MKISSQLIPKEFLENPLGMGIPLDLRIDRVFVA